MKTKDRIKELEDMVSALSARVGYLEARVAAMPQFSYTSPGYVYPWIGPSSITVTGAYDAQT